MELKDRERKVDVSKMSPEQVAILEAQIGGRMREICDKAVNEANRILNIYGLNAKMQFLIHNQELSKEDIKKQISKPVQEEQKKKRGRPRKVPQSLS